MAVGHLRNAHPFEFLLAERLTTFFNSAVVRLLTAVNFVFDVVVVAMLVVVTGHIIYRCGQ